MTLHPFLFSPADAEEAARVLRTCTRLAGEGRTINGAVVESPEGRCILVQGASSSLEKLETLASSDTALVLVTHRAMSRIREISREDYLAVVDGGVRFGDFTAAVRDAGLFFPHAPDETTQDATIAGLVMAGAKFPTERRFGRLREYILSLELVIPKGEIIRAGSRSVKDVTGYDLIGFAIGAGGRCGMIARATLRLLPKPFGGAPTDAYDEPGGAATHFEDRLARPAALQALDEKVFDVLDPAGIMKQAPPGVDENGAALRRWP